MEIKEIPFGFIANEKSSLPSTVRETQSFSQTPAFPPLERDASQQNRKLRLECQQLIRKKALKKRIQEREKGVEQRLQEMKNKQRMNLAQSQKAWYPVSEEKEYKSAKKVHNSLEKRNVETQILFHKRGQKQKQNTFMIYHKAGKAGELPRIKKQRPGAKQDFIRPKNEELSLVDLGIFSERKNAGAFLKKLKTTLERQFLSGIDLESEEKVQKLETVIVSQVGNERRRQAAE